MGSAKVCVIRLLGKQIQDNEINSCITEILFEEAMYK